MQVPRRASLREVLTVSSQGQITLPAEMRRHLGIEPGDAVIVEVCGGELRLKPAAVLEVEL
ncbi:MULTISPECIES: AbrB/MazE/SpoVT family DNA-binding domain-containing protein [unclassified Cyanobium]|uniref:AbrB/MazE/SpoVT family DNA-binding domain-containing protein n=1 Tax=unclassified Cyanobium TaxID=2627006 RepID=UPI0020CEC46C|nr:MULTISPECIES: AbrB/MazE/SpoVT family DNA-binding domain-containing protein [unclassified Cyanobium]MCP9861509.1 AbrB/MazE/SpoVT family DNA-binding domain-containing protein [Cyanobium sp. Cruz-8H5]